MNQTLFYISNTKADPDEVRFIQVSLYSDLINNRANAIVKNAIILNYIII